MKKLSSLLLIAMFAATLVNCGGGPKPGYVINGDVEGLDGEVYLLKGKDTVNVAQVNNGKFVMSGELPEPGAYMITTKRLPMMLLIDEWDTLSLTGNVLRFKPGERIFTVTGSDANDAFTELGNRLMELTSGAREITSMEERDSVMRLQTDIVLAAAGENTDNLLSVYLLSVPQPLVGTSPEEIMAILEKTPERLKKTSLYETTVKRYESASGKNDGSE